MHRKNEKRSLAGLTPEKRIAAEWRVAVLRRYCAIENPTLADAKRAADELKLSTGSLYRLAKVWRTTKDFAKVLSPGGNKPIGRRPHPGDGLVKRVLGSLPGGRPIARDVLAVQAAAREEGVAIRTGASLQDMIRDFRAEENGVPGAELADMFIDHVAIELAIESPVGPTMPIASVLARGNALLCIRLSLTSPGPRETAELLLHAIQDGVLVSGSSGRPITMAIDVDARHDWAPLIASLDEQLVSRIGEEWRVPQGGRLGSALLHPRLLDIRTHTKAVARCAAKRPLPARRSARIFMSLDEGQAIIDDLVRRLGNQPFELPGDAGSLAAALERLI